MRLGHDRRFGPFRLDMRNERLWRGADELVLRPKTFAVLAYLATRAGELVTRDQLLEALWPGVAVTEAVLTVCIGEIRQALGDDPRAARYVETVHRRGYRFIAPLVADPTPPPAPETRAAPHESAAIVGRDAELARLEGCLEQARRGVRGVVFVTGEAGIGKTSLVDAFLDRVGAGTAQWCARGQCIAHYGAGEAYLPVLDALSRLGREPDSGLLRECLSRHAPTWLLQLPTLAGTSDELEALRRRTVETGPRRMLRELAEALEALTAERPLILVLEDLHWSDYATLDLISWLAQRQEPARLLLVGTYRPVEVIVRDHPLQSVKQELTRHGRCLELPLELLTASEVGRHLAGRFGAPLDDLARTIHRRTDGHPLFLVTLLDGLVQQGWLVEHSDRWEIRPGIETATQEVPKSLQDLVEQQFQQLDTEDQGLLEAAGVVGLEGSAAAVAAGLATEVTTVEDRCAALARRGQFLQSIGGEEWPDGTVAGRYRFRHTLYRQVVYDRLPVGRRVQLHARIGERQAVGYGALADERAAELATHFEQGRVYERALHFRRQAAENAMGRYAYQEAIGHLHRGLALLPRLPEGPERARQELPFRVALGDALSAVHGPAASAVGGAYTRAQALCEQVQDAPMHLAVLQGLRRHYLGRAEVPRARELGEAVLVLAERLPDPAQLRKAHAALGTCLFYLGELPAARAHLMHGMADGDPARPWTSLSSSDFATDVLPRFSMGLVLCLLGYPDQAVVYTDRMLALAGDLGAPLVQVSALGHAAVVHQFRRDVRMTQERAATTMRLAAAGGFSLWGAQALTLHGWALAMQDRTAEGIEQISRGLQAWRTNEQRLGQPYLLGLLAEAHGRAGRAETGLGLLDEALAIVEAHGIRTYESGLHRTKGDLLAMLPGAARHEAEASFRRAIDIARRQQARSLELRAALGLTRLGRASSVAGELSAIYASFTEGFDTVDLREARALLGDEPARP